MLQLVVGKRGETLRRRLLDFCAYTFPLPLDIPILHSPIISIAVELNLSDVGRIYPKNNSVWNEVFFFFTIQRSAYFCAKHGFAILTPRQILTFSDEIQFH